jgi:TolA-binding protein
LLKDKNNEAIQNFETISESEETTMKAGAMFNLALLYEASGDKEKSDELFRTIANRFPDQYLQGSGQRKN